MIAAIYARKSTEQNGVADEARSVARQIENARAYATRKGWTVDDGFVFVDDGISGAEFAKRPGFLLLMNALKPRPPFQVLVMSEESRLGREAIETAYALKHSHVERRINDAEAAVVLRIFELTARRHGKTTITKVLNAEHALAPRAQQGRLRSWSPSSIHAILYRPLYRGQIVWNRKKKRDLWGQHKETVRAQADWICRDARCGSCPRSYGPGAPRSLIAAPLALSPETPQRRLALRRAPVICVPARHL